MAIGTWSVEALTVLGLFRGGRELHGYAICEETSLQQGTVYPILYRFVREGFLSKSVERIDPHLSRREPRVVYRGTTCADDQLAVLRALVS